MTAVVINPDPALIEEFHAAQAAEKAKVEEFEAYKRTPNPDPARINAFYDEIHQCVRRSLEAIEAVRRNGRTA